MPIPTITALPTAPNRNTPVTFADDADAFLGALPGFRLDLLALAAYLLDTAAAVFTGTSTSSVLIGTGAKVFNVAGMALVPNQTVIISDAANSANVMTGTVTSYTGGVLTMNVTAFTGTGTKASWIIGLAPSATVALGFITGLGTNVAAFLAAPSSATLLAMLADETGTGAAVFGTAPALSNPSVTNYTEPMYAPAAGSAFTVDLANGTRQRFVTNANATITLPASVAGKSYLIEVEYGGAHTLAFAGGTTRKYAAGVSPVPTSVVGKIDVFACLCDGTQTLILSPGANF